MRLRYEKLAVIFFWSCALITSGAVLTIVIFLVKKGFSTLSLKLIFGDVDPLKALLFKERVFEGLFPALVGTFLVILLSVSWAIPLGVAAGIYLAEFSNPKIKELFNSSMDILASVPSIVIGLFGLTLAIFLHRHLSGRIYPCLLISSIALAVLVLPYLVRTTQLSLEAVPHPIRLAGISAGASRLQNLFHVLLPNSLSGILSGVILSLGRSAEDTAVIMLTGAVATAGIPKSVLEKYEALPFYVYYVSSQYTDQSELMKGFGAAIILLLICTVLFIIAHILKKGVVRHFNRR